MEFISPMASVYPLVSELVPVAMLLVSDLVPGLFVGAELHHNEKSSTICRACLPLRPGTLTPFLFRLNPLASQGGPCRRRSPRVLPHRLACVKDTKSTSNAVEMVVFMSRPKYIGS